ncbi:MAG TPA: rhomboid family intramembrane serine protease [Acidobacteriota bacterium]|nr:rhomboid family intramembrane serine protease [Acidobacteriota bacterium]
MYTPQGQGRMQVRIGGPLTPVVKALLIANAAIYLFTVIPVMIGSQGGTEVVANIVYYLGMTPAVFWGDLTLWMPITYMFLHSLASPMHVLFNMLALWMFGGDVEKVFGARQFAVYYLFCGIGAGLLVAMLQPGLGIPTIGASGAIYGIIIAFGLFFPERVILMGLLFPIKAKYFVMIIGAIVFFSSLGGPGGEISHVAHLGGFVFGFFYIKRHKIWRWFGALLSRRRKPKLRVIDTEKLRRLLEDDDSDDHVVH